jgi:uncharacterized protein (DUF983 family)
VSRPSERCGWHTRGVSTQRNGARSLLATIVGYIIVAIVVLFVFHFIVGTILWLFRTLVVVVIVVALLSIYLTLKAPD